MANHASPTLSELGPDDFVASGLKHHLHRAEQPGKKVRRPAIPAARRLRAFYGRALTELEKLDKVLSESGFVDTPGPYEWTPEIWGPVFEPAKGQNLCVELIAQAQDKWPPLLEELFGGAVALGWTRSGDLWLYGLYDSAGEPARHAVHLWSHGTARIKSTVATDLDAFVLAQVLADLVGEGAITSKAAARVAERLIGRVYFTWPFDRILEKLVKGGGRPAPSAFPTALYADRSAWIKAALLGEPGSGIRAEFEPELNRPLDAKAFKKLLDEAATTPPTAAYLLFRCFLFGQMGRLSDAITVCARSPAPIVRDAARLMEELLRGRTRLGQIGDMQALQAEVVSLGLDPEAVPEKKLRLAKR